MKRPLVPVPVKVNAPGDAVTIHVPEEGKPPSITLPVETVQEGCVTSTGFENVGAAGDAFEILNVMLALEKHEPYKLVIDQLNVYNPAKFKS